MIRIPEFADLRLGQDGIWYPLNQTRAEVSYPADGNSGCFSVEDKSYWFKHRNKVILHAIHQAKIRVDWLLDIGGGNGVVAAALEKSGIPAVVLEPGSVGAKNALTRGVSAVINSTLEASSIKKASIPAAGLFDVLEHFSDDSDVLKKVRAFLQPNGYLIVAVPAHQLLWSAADKEAGHFRRYTQASLASKMKSAGFRMVYSSYFFSPLVLPIFFSRSLWSLLGRDIEKSAAPSSGHGTEGGLLTGLMKLVLRMELALLRLFGKSPFGASLIVIAKREERFDPKPG